MIGATVFWVSIALVVYVYAGYPMLVTLLARVRPQRPWPDAPLPKITLLIAAYNEEAEIAAKLDAVLDLDYPSDLMQVIVAADGSTDRTAAIVSTYADRGVELVHRPERRGKMAAINRAAAWATGEVLVFSDANNRFERDALRHLVHPFAAGRVGMTVGYKTVTGPDGLGHSEGAYWRYEAHIRRMETRLGCTVGVNGEICAIRRDLFRAAPEHIINDDQWMSHMVITGGHDVIFTDKAVSRELVSASASDEKERRTRMVAGQYQILGRPWRDLPWRRPLIAWMFLSHKVLRPLVPFGMAGALIGAAAAVVASDGAGPVQLGGAWGVVALGAQLAFYALAAVGAHTRRFGIVGYVPRFLVDSNVAAVKGLWRHLTRSQTALWERAERLSQ